MSILYQDVSRPPPPALPSLTRKIQLFLRPTDVVRDSKGKERTTQSKNFSDQPPADSPTHRCLELVCTRCHSRKKATKWGKVQSKVKKKKKRGTNKKKKRKRPTDHSGREENTHHCCIHQCTGILVNIGAKSLWRPSAPRTCTAVHPSRSRFPSLSPPSQLSALSNQNTLNTPPHAVPSPTSTLPSHHPPPPTDHARTVPPARGDATAAAGTRRHRRGWRFTHKPAPCEEQSDAVHRECSRSWPTTPPPP